MVIEPRSGKNSCVKLKIGVQSGNFFEIDSVNETNIILSISTPSLSAESELTQRAEHSANQEIFPTDVKSETHSSGHDGSQIVFEQIALDLLNKGYSTLAHALPKNIADALHHHMTHMPEYKFSDASIGRSLDNHHNSTIRNDQIVWIDGDSPAGQLWLAWANELKVYLNRRLFLGLFSFESHFAHYPPGHFYKRHVDSFKGQTNRILSLVTYLNIDWQKSDGGELIIYEQLGNESGIEVMPDYGNICVFMSEEFEHEVKPTNRDRYSIAGWFRVNTTTSDKVDPPK